MPELQIAPSWRDPRWRRGLAKLPAARQHFLMSSLRELLKALQDCRHPLLDGTLQAWSPKKWATLHAKRAHGTWVEYNLGDDDNRGRAVVCANKSGDVIFLVCRTAIHDHAALNELAASFSPKKTIDGDLAS